MEEKKELKYVNMEYVHRDSRCMNICPSTIDIPELDTSTTYLEGILHPSSTSTRYL